MNPNTPPWMGGIGPQFSSVEDIAPNQFESGIFFYASAGILDPKAPVVDVPLAARALQVGYWTAYGMQLPWAVVGGLAIGIVFDPAHKFPNWGLDEVWEWGPKHEYESWQVPTDPWMG